MAIRASILEPNYDSFFDRARIGQPAQLRIKLKVTLIPLDPSTPWARAQHASKLPGAPAGAMPPSHLAANPAAYKRGSVVDAGGQPVPCRSWLVSEWQEFTHRFKCADTLSLSAVMVTASAANPKVCRQTQFGWWPPHD